MEAYEDIINLPHHTSKKYPRMNRRARAAQFGAFRALTGHEDAVEEVARTTEPVMHLSDAAAEDLNFKLKDALENAKKITITYFVPDEKKEGGKYVKCQGIIAKHDYYSHTLLLDTGKKIPIDMITDVN
ncbi:MAG: YolD-like family protein [Clostridia bacterium]|nr:YolD-like family protein [Clostridia bacterium]